jgi:hypothetical protein
MCSLMLNQKRSSMASFQADILSFIHDNYGKLFPISRQVGPQKNKSSVKSYEQFASVCRLLPFIYFELD